MRIGFYTLNNRLILAPMAGVTDRPLRILCRRLGAGMAVSEMLTANTQLWNSYKSQRRMDHCGEPGVRSVQILGTEPQIMAKAARINAAQGAQIIDINMGCPAKKVCNVMAGSALLKDEALVARILTAVVNAVDVPVTLKIRIGWDTQHINGVRIAKIAEQCGIQALAVHGRTRSDGYHSPVNYAAIRCIKDAVAIPVIANGNIDSPEQAAAVLAITAADGLMIGRAAQGNPWIFRQIHHFLNHGALLPKPSLNEICAVALEHMESLYKFYGYDAGVRIARKHIKSYLKQAFPAQWSQHWPGICRAEQVGDQQRLVERALTH